VDFVKKCQSRWFYKKEVVSYLWLFIKSFSYISTLVFTHRKSVRSIRVRPRPAAAFNVFKSRFDPLYSTVSHLLFFTNTIPQISLFHYALATPT
jgi:hypothetical protein